MGYRETIAKNISWITLADVFNYLVSFFFVIYLTKKIGDYSYGVFNYLRAFVGIIFIFSELGAGVYFTRKWATDITHVRDEYTILNSIKFCSSALLFAIILWYGLHFHQDIFFELLIYSIIVIVGTFRSSNIVYFSSQNQFIYNALASIIERVISAVLGVLVLFLGYQLRAYLLVLLVATIISFLCQRQFIHIPLWLSFSPRKIYTILRKSFTFFLISVSLLIYQRVDVILLTHLDGFRSVGWYSAAYNIVNVLNFFPSVFMVAFFPSMRQLYFQDYHRLERFFDKIVRYLLLISIPMAIIILLRSSQIIATIYAPEFAPAAYPLMVLILAEIFVFLNSVYVTLLVTQEKERLIGWIIFSIMILNILLNVIFISRWSIIGAATVTLITECVRFILMYRAGGLALNFSYLPAVILNGIIIALSVFFFGHLPLLIVLPMVGGIYLICSLFVIKTIDREDLRVFLHLWH